MAETKWHPAFCAALRLELKDNESLQFEDDFNLNEEPLRVDLLVINKPSNVKITNQIGEFFEEHNLLEYKSPTDHKYNEFALYQAMSYAYYYCYRNNTKDVTLTLVASRNHFNMLKWLDKQKIKYSKRYDGIYRVEGVAFLKFQVVITEEIDSGAFAWLSALTDRLTELRARQVITTAYGMEDAKDRLLAEAVVQAVTSANVALFEKIKEDQIMASALMELMKPEVEKYAENKVEEERGIITKIISALVAGKDNDTIMNELNCSLDQIIPIRAAMNK